MRHGSFRARNLSLTVPFSLSEQQTSLPSPFRSGNTTPCRITGVTFHSHVRYKGIQAMRSRLRCTRVRADKCCRTDSAFSSVYAASHLHCTAGSSRSFTAIRKEAGLCCGSRLRKGEVFAYVGLPQNLKDLNAQKEDTPHTRHSTVFQVLKRNTLLHQRIKRTGPRMSKMANSTQRSSCAQHRARPLQEYLT